MSYFSENDYKESGVSSEEYDDIQRIVNLEREAEDAKARLFAHHVKSICPLGTVAGAFYPTISSVRMKRCQDTDRQNLPIDKFGFLC